MYQNVNLDESHNFVGAETTQNCVWNVDEIPIAFLDPG